MLAAPTRPASVPSRRSVVVAMYAWNAIAIAILFFTMGQFEFFDMVGGKRLVQGILLAGIVVLGGPVLATRPAYWRSNPLVLLAGAMAVSWVVFASDALSALEMLAAALLVATVFTLPWRYVELLISVLVIVATFFALLALLEFVVLVFRPELVDATVSYLLQPVRGGAYYVSHPIAYLGLTTGERRSLFGLIVVRLSSFMREPSLVVPYFVLPGVLALTARTAIRWLALPLFLFSLLCLTGAFYAVVLMMIPAVMMLYASRKLWRGRGRQRAIFVTSVAGLCLGAIVLYQTNWMDRLVLLLFRNAFILEHIEKLEFLDRASNALQRLELIRGFWADSRPGSSDGMTIPTAIGMLGYALALGGFPALALEALFLLGMMRAVATLHARTGQTVIPGFLLAIYAQAALFNMYGMMSSSGFLINALVLRRLRRLGGLDTRPPPVRGKPALAGRLPESV